LEEIYTGNFHLGNFSTIFIHWDADPDTNPDISELKQSLTWYGDVTRNHPKFYTFIIIKNYSY
jgi:hypothetical protein